MRPLLARRIAAASLILAWSAAMIQEAASRETPVRKHSSTPAKALAARKTPLPSPGVLPRETVPADAAADPAPSPAAGGRPEFTQPDYLRVFCPGIPHGHRDPPV